MYKTIFMIGHYVLLPSQVPKTGLTNLLSSQLVKTSYSVWNVVIFNYPIMIGVSCDRVLSQFACLIYHTTSMLGKLKLWNLILE